MKRAIKNLFLLTLCLVMALSSYLPFLNNIPKAKATEEDSALDTSDTMEVMDGYNLDSSGNIIADQIAPIPTSIQQAATSYEKSFPQGAQADPGSFNFDEVFSNSSNTNAKIYLYPKERKALHSLLCLNDILPDYDADPTALYSVLPDATKQNIQNSITAESQSATPRFTTTEEYLLYLKMGLSSEPVKTQWDNSEIYKNILKEAQANGITDDRLKQLWENEASKIGSTGTYSVSVNTLSCITNIDPNDIQGYLQNDQGRTYIRDKIKNMVETLSIDIRVIKSLVYLVTPKDQGGAGHWRIKVRRILQNQEDSTESDATIKTTLAAESQATSETVICDPSLSAAECGQQLDKAAAGTVEDQNGNEYELWLKDIKATQSAEESIKELRNTSAHYYGQAFDVSEVDDIRCTLVKKKRIGGWIKTKQPVKPIKLAWQTTDGYDQNGGGDNFDMMAIMKNAASESMLELMDSMNGDLTNYSGDLSEASLTDMIGLIGQSMLGYVLQSPGTNLKGYDTSSTLKSLGSMYIADYLGLPREIFVNANINSIEDVKHLIGRSYVEKKLGLPYGSLDSFNPVESAKQKKIVNNLQGIFINTGLKKLEKEMNLESGDLTSFITSADQSRNLPAVNLIGNKVIENELHIVKGTWPTTNKKYNDMKSSLSPVIRELLQKDPSYIDGILNLKTGTTANFFRNGIGALDYSSLVGTVRMNDTSFGLKYFAMNDSAYRLPEGTWQAAMTGDLAAVQSVGIYTIARIFAQDSLEINTSGALDPNQTLSSATLSAETITYKREDFGAYVLRQWLKDSLGRTADVTDTTCDPKAKGFSWSFNADMTGRIVISGATDQVADASCVLVQSIEAILSYSDGSGGGTKASTAYYLVNSDKAKSAGLESYDFYRMFGYSEADGSAIFKRIGSKVLYFGFANKLLGPADQAKMSLLDSDMTLNINNKDVAFYLTRIAQTKDLVERIKADWSETQQMVSGTSGLTSEITDANNRIGSIISHLEKISKDTFDAQTMFANLRDVGVDIDQLSKEMDLFRTRFIPGADAVLQTQIRKINNMITDVNELSRVVSEIFAGKSIPSANTLKIDQINTISLSDLANSSDSGRSRGSINSGLSQFQLTAVIFGFLAGEMPPVDLFMRIGAATAEANLGLPANSLYYLATNYESIGDFSIDSFYKSIGQARTEEQFSMPANYFQGYTLAQVPPAFDTNYSALMQWARSEIILAQVDGTISMFVPIDETLLASLKTEQPDFFQTLVSAAQNHWRTAYKVSPNSSTFTTKTEATLDDVVANINAKGFGDGIRSAENDLLFRMGFSTGRYSSMVAGSTTAWMTESGRAAAIDQSLDLKNGSTKSLFTGSTTLNQTDVSSNEKDQLQAGMSLNKNAVEKYVSVLNGQLLSSELQALQSPSSNIDYVQTNPYAQQAAAGVDTCPISYTLDGGFYVNNSTLVNNSFVYYDQDGRHSFQSQEEAQRYADLHTDKQFTDIFSLLASALYLKYDAARLSTAGLPTMSYQQMKDGLTNFASNQKTYSIFAVIERDVTKEQGMANGALQAISDTTNVSLGILKKLFTRDLDSSPVANYKKMVGQKEAQKVITYEIFDALNIDISPDMFDSGDLYAILHGDYSSLYRIGTSMIDNALDLKQGTTMMVYLARDPNTLKCALLNAGGTMLGGLMGLNNVPINVTGGLDGFMANVGQEKVEETLGLPRGSFRGANIADVIKNVKPINFILDFKIPIEGLIDQTSLADILGTQQAQGLLYTSDIYKLTRIREFLLSNAAVSSKAYTAVIDLDIVLTFYIQAILEKVKSTDPFDTIVFDQNLVNNIVQDPVTSSSFRTSLMRWQNGATAFYRNLHYLDSIFNLPTNTSYNLLTDRITPVDYANKVGNSLVVNVGLSKIAEALGLTPDQSEAATTLATNLQKIFSCSGTLRNNVCYSGGATVDPVYHNWAMLYGNLDRIFGFNLDEKAGLPHGTIELILITPENTFPILFAVAANKLDASLSLDSTKAYSFTGLYKGIYGDILTSDRSTCEAQFYSAATRDELQTKLIAAEKDMTVYKASTPSYDTAVANKKALEIQIAALDKQVSDCMLAARSAHASDLDRRLGIPSDFRDRAWEWLQQAGAEYLHDQIYNIKIKNSDGISERIGIDVPIEHIRAMFEGDTKEYQVIGLALLANYVYVVDPIRTKNCNPSEMSGGECRTAIPAELRINYDDIYMAFYGVPNYGANGYRLAAWIDVTGGNSNPNIQAYNLNPGAPLTGGGNTNGLNILLDTLASPVSNSVEGAINLANERTGFNVDAYNAEIARLRAISNPTEADLLALDRLQNSAKYYDPNSPNFVGTSTTMARVDTDMRKAARDYLEYKTMDGMLWKLDDNVFPGFSRALMTGNTEIKMAAMSMYIRNGLIHGHIFGINFDAIDPVAIAAAASMVQYFTATNADQKQAVLDNFVRGSGFDYLTNFITSNSKDWLGFELTPAMTQGLLAGIFTGQWGLKAISLDGIFAASGAETVKIGGRDIPTLGGAVASWAVPKLFTWADRALGLEDGQSFQLAYAGYKIYTATQALKAVKPFLDMAKTAINENGLTLAQGLSQGALGAAEVVNYLNKNPLFAGEMAQKFGFANAKELTEAIANGSGGVGAIAEDLNNAIAKEAALKAAQSIGLQILIDILLQKLIGKQISTFEHSLGLVPGSLMPLISTAVYNVAIHAFNMNLATLPFTYAIIIFVLLNLFGVYKVEMWCSADGYYPMIESPQPSVNDFSGLGEWGGDVTGKNINQTMKNGSIAAAQYKAKRLIGDMLAIGDNSKFNDSAGDPTTPIQIMTGRSDDVAFWQNTIDSNMCKRRLGEDSTVIYQDGRAICDGDTRLGVWSNPQTIAWTHIGF